MPVITNDMHPDAPSNEGDNSPNQALAFFPAILLVAVVLAVLLSPALRKFIRNFRPPHDDEFSSTESSGSSSNADSARRSLDSIAPPKACNKMREQLEARPRLPPWARLGSLVICAICLDTIEDDDLVRHLPCEHNFHSDCISRWFMRRHDTCPICSIHLMTPSRQHGRTEQG
ncbi:RING-type domain-containing protein [Fusarium falciforme]|uniref:RING-type domain-containing protein n=1 Tax=Fusarium falciforme TaxID=195108 RepID=UPI0023014119|nr:RING-type domain-containing protein [Fusarium falciforme]WAO95481.1 RING-type domain-containing protein [Fusarium falciforme]